MADEWNVDLYDTWAGNSRAISIAHPVFLPAQVADPTVSDMLFYQFDGQPLNTFPVERFFALERQGIVLEAAGIAPSEMKLITAIYPIVQGPVGLSLNFYLGGEIGQPGSGVTYTGPYPFIIGTTTKIDCLVTCRYPAYKVQTTTRQRVIVEALGVEFESIGQD